jgi:DNA-binding NarL/FixJ family response regulator
MAACLASDGFRVVGESAHLDPRPSGESDAVIFDARDGDLDEIVTLARRHRAALVATVRYPNDRMLGELVEAGIVAILLFDDLSPAALVAAVRASLHGHASLSNDVLLRLLDRPALGDPPHQLGLTGRERRVLTLLADGQDTRTIADDLCYSERTIKNIVHELLTKMGCRNRVHAVAQAARQGVI